MIDQPKQRTKRGLYSENSAERVLPKLAQLDFRRTLIRLHFTYTSHIFAFQEAELHEHIFHAIIPEIVDDRLI